MSRGRKQAEKNADRLLGALFLTGSPVPALLWQEFLPSLISDHLQYLIKRFLISHLWYLISAACLQQKSCYPWTSSSYNLHPLGFLLLIDYPSGIWSRAQFLSLLVLTPIANVPNSLPYHFNKCQNHFFFTNAQSQRRAFCPVQCSQRGQCKRKGLLEGGAKSHGLENYFQKAELEPSQGTFSPHRGERLCNIGPGDGRIAVDKWLLHSSHLPFFPFLKGVYCCYLTPELTPCLNNCVLVPMSLKE